MACLYGFISVVLYVMAPGLLSIKRANLMPSIPKFPEKTLMYLIPSIDENYPVDIPEVEVA